MLTPDKAARKKVFYGWFVVLGCFAVTAILGEIFFQFGVFFKPLEEEFNWSRSLVSSGSTSFLIGYSISMLVSGRLADRIDPRFILFPTAVLAGLGFVLCSYMYNAAQYLSFLFITGLGCGATLSVPLAITQRWFHGRRNAGTALSVVSSGTGVGEVILIPLINYIVLSYGWRSGYLFTGIVSFIVVFIGSIIVRRSPSETKTSLQPSGESLKPVGIEGLSTSKAMATVAFGYIVYTACATAIALQVVTVHLVPHATDVGIASTLAAAALGLIGGLTIPSRLVSGFIADKIGWQRALALGCFVMTASMVCLIFLGAAWTLYGFVLLFGVGWGIRFVTLYGILGDFFGMRSVGALIGITGSIGTMVSAVAPFLVGFLFDVAGSYTIAFIIVAALLFSSALGVMLIKKPLLTPQSASIRG